MKQKDPEFYKFLQENDKNLLAFGENEDDEGDDDGEEDENEDEDEDEDDVGDSELLEDHAGGEGDEDSDEEDSKTHETFKKKKEAKKLTKERVDKWAKDLAEVCVSSGYIIRPF